MYTYNWAVAYGSVTGNQHVEHNLPCQDACLVKQEEGYGIAVVCDGAGSCEHSDLGAKMTCEFAYNYLRKAIEENKWNTAESLPTETEWREIAYSVLFKVKTDLFNYSIEKDVDFKSLSCTAICVIFFPFGLLSAHIGDGRGGYLQDGNWHSLFTPFQGEFAGETVFITSRIWDSDSNNKYFSVNVVNGPVSSFCLLTDGCEKASFEMNLLDKEKGVYYDPNIPFPGFFNPNVQVLEKLVLDGKSQEEINELWALFLKKGNKRFESESDDKTMVLAVNMAGKETIAEHHEPYTEA